MQAELPDSRDSRGKKHELAFVITCFIVAILKRYDLLSLSKIHRTMKHVHDECALAVGSQSKTCISRVQLTRVLEDSDFESFNRITEGFFGFAVSKEKKQWKAIDGKELRGSINCSSGDKRGESVVIETDHFSKESKVLGHYSALKESEKTVVSEYFGSQQDLTGRRFTLDALHNSEALLSEIEAKNGIYLTQIKSNQKLLSEDLRHIRTHLNPAWEEETLEKGHGRIDCRLSSVYHANTGCLEPRWSESGIKTLICVKRKRYNIKKKAESVETSYYVSNLELKGNEKELSDAVRNHWSVETNNALRDVSFGEDFIKSSKPFVLRFVSSVLTAVLNGLTRINHQNNMRETREELADRSINDCDFFFL